MTSRSLPTLEGRQVVLKVVRAGVCHTDTDLREGGYDLGSRGTRSMKDRGIEYPMVVVHEVVGAVEQVGDGVETVRQGDVRLIYPWIGCGQWRECRERRDNRCAAGRNLGVARPGATPRAFWCPTAGECAATVTSEAPACGGWRRAAW
jgi:alcohol dehydrogenase/propanol-preferring alcohol dehydrogenase